MTAMDNYLKTLNQEKLNPRGLRISHYRYFYFIELTYDPQIYFKEKTRQENLKLLRKDRQLMYGEEMKLERLVKYVFKKKKNRIDDAQNNILEFDKSAPIHL